MLSLLAARTLSGVRCCANDVQLDVPFCCAPLHFEAQVSQLVTGVCSFMLEISVLETFQSFPETVSDAQPRTFGRLIRRNLFIVPATKSSGSLQPPVRRLAAQRAAAIAWRGPPQAMRSGEQVVLIVHEGRGAARKYLLLASAISTTSRTSPETTYSLSRG